MNPPYNNIFRKVESALKSYLEAALTTPQLDGAAIHLGISNDTLAVPYIYCHCPDGEEDEIGTGNYNVEAEIGVVVNASDETSAEAADRLGAVQDAIMQTTLKASLMAAVAGLTVFGVKHINAESGTEGNRWTAKIRVGMMVCGSAL